MAERQIVAVGGGKFCEGLAAFLARLTGRERPRVLYIGTASAEDPESALRMYDRFGPRVELSRLEFFPWPPDDLRAAVLEQDLIFVGGGNTANMLAIWRVHGVDGLLREAWDRGVVLAGSSAGGICWFAEGVTDSFGPQLEKMDCLGFLPGSFCPHYDDEELRRPRYHELLQNGLVGGYAADAGVGLHFVSGELREVVACEDGSRAYRVEVRDGEVVEEPIEARVLLPAAGGEVDVIELRPMTPEFIEAALAGRREEAERLLGIEVPDEFPTDGEKSFLGLRLRQMREDERFKTWCPHAVVLGRQMIGHAGYHGPPGVNSKHAEDAVEFGYSIWPPFRGRGYATEAAMMLMDQARERAGISHFVLSVGPHNTPSLAIVRKLGFVRTGEQMDEVDGLELVFELRRDDARAP